ncbi:MAG: transposase [Bdellovibrionaceae bacterium]|nr:transposase [Pseudobdellovibrionaceae bacterium]
MFQANASLYSNQFSSLNSSSKSSTGHNFFGVLRLESMDYFTTLPDAEKYNRQQYFSARFGLTGLSPDGRAGYGADLQAGKYNFGASNYSIQEIFLFYRLESFFKVVLGRKKVEWSALDSYWKTSLWQPKYAIDYLRPEEQGLMGAFFEYKRSDFQFLALTTPIFIPNMGIDVREEGGTLKSDSRWFRVPSNKYDFNGRIKTITYDLSMPETRNLISRPGVGFNLLLGDRSRGFWANQSAGYKPVNDLILKREGYAAAAEKSVKVVVSPDVTYHSVLSLDVGYSFENFKVISSYIEDNPKEKIPVDEWVIQSLGAMKGYSLMVENNLESSLIRDLKIQLGYLRIYGGGISDINARSEKDSFTLFDERFYFYNSMLFKTEGKLFKLFNRDFTTKFSYLRDFSQKGSLVNTEFQFYPFQSWAILVGGDFISVDVEDDASSFLNQNRANDRIYAGVNYVF